MNRLFLLFAKAFCCIALCCIVPVSCGGGDVEIPPPPSTAPGGGDDNPDDDEPKPDPNPDPDEPTRLKIVDPQATDQTKALYSNLWAVASRGFMFGHHDDLWYGRYWYDVPGGRILGLFAGTILLSSASIWRLSWTIAPTMRATGRRMPSAGVSCLKPTAAAR